MTDEISSIDKQYDDAINSDSTKKAYAKDVADFKAWCEEKKLKPLPALPSTIVAYLTARAETLKVATLKRRIAAISRLHELAHVPSPTKDPDVKLRLRGIQRVKGSKQNRKRAIKSDLLERVLSTIPDTTLVGLRDRSILLTGFIGGFRRSEFTRITVSQLEFHPDGVILHIGRSKTDQEGRGAKIVLAKHPTRPDLCPVNALRRWMKFASITGGYVYRECNSARTQFFSGPPDPKTVSRIIKRAIEKLGMDMSNFSAHSLRAGFVTDALGKGAPYHTVMAQTRHKNIETLLRYEREEDPTKNNAATMIWNKGEEKK